MKLITALAAVAALFAAGCANVNTIGRATTYGPPPTNDAYGGKVVHLDIQQRLFIANNMGKFCAEPSPDAMAAFSAALGIGGSSQAGAISGAFGGSGSAASVGLRTQSITLMRDALYRMCEAYANGNLSKAQVMTLLGRSQDLAAVILATEQLTGTVKANQAALVNDAEATATAAMIGSADRLEIAQDRVDRYQARVEEAQTAYDEAVGAREDAEQAVTDAKAVTPGPDPDEVKRAERALKIAQTTEKTRETVLDMRKERLEAAEVVVSEIAAQEEFARAESEAKTDGSSSFSQPGVAVQLSKEATEKVADTVENIVTAVLGKSYATDYCLAIMEDKPQGATAQSAAIVDTCQKLILRVASAEIQRFDNLVGENTFGVDNNSVCLTEWQRGNPSNRENLKTWVAENADGVILGSFLTQDRFAAKRAEAAKRFKVTCPK